MFPDTSDDEEADNGLDRDVVLAVGFPFCTERVIYLQSQFDLNPTTTTTKSTKATIMAEQSMRGPTDGYQPSARITSHSYDRRDV